MDDEKKELNRQEQHQSMNGPAPDGSVAQKTYHEKAMEDAEDKLRKAESMLSGLRTGVSLTIARLQPGWCKGYLERIDCSDDESIDMDYIVNEWGGKQLRLRVCDSTGQYLSGVDVPLFSYPPRRRGKILLRQSDYYEENPTNHNHDTPKQISGPLPQQQPAATLDFGSLLGMLQKTRKEDLNVLQAMFNQGQTPPPDTRNQFDDFLEMAVKMKQLNGLFGGEGGSPEPTTDQGALLGSIAEIVKGFSGPKSPPPAPSQPRVVPPAQPQFQRPPMQPIPQEQKNNEENADLGSVNALSDSMSTFSPDKFRDTFLTTLMKMPQDHREQAIQQLLDAAGIEYDDDESIDDIEETPKT